MTEIMTKSLGELTSIITKGIAPRYVEETSNSTVVVLNQKCNRDFSISLKWSRLNDCSKKKVTPERMLRKYDVLINSTGIGTAGRVAQLFDVPEPMTIDGHMILIRPTDEIDPIYYGYAVKSHQAEIERLAEGSTGQTEINRNRLETEIKISFPKDIAIQKQIGRFLYEIDQKIKNNIEINDNLEQQATALFRAWFVDYLPFGGIMPQSWAIRTLGEVTEMGAGGDKPEMTSQIKTQECQYPIYSNGISDYGLYGYTNEPKIIAESVTVSARGTIGYVCLRHNPYVPIVRLVTLIPNTEILSAKYLYLYLKQLNITGTGTTQQQLTVPDFRKTKIFIPDKITMGSFTETIAPLFDKMWTNESENATLVSVRNTLLPKLMSGELDISNVNL